MLAEAQASVASQTFCDLGHLVVVDENRVGPALIRNGLVRRSLAEWIVFLDDDDLLDPGFVELHLRHALSHSADVVYSLCRYPENSERRPPITGFDAVRLRRGNYIPVTALVRRSMFNKTAGFNPSARFEDHRLWLDMLDSGARFSHLPQVCWTYRIYGGTGVRYGKRDALCPCH